MKHRRAITVVAMVMLLAGLMVAPVSAQPPVCTYTGVVTVDDADVADGTDIVAKVDGAVVGGLIAPVASSEYAYVIAQVSGVPAEGATVNFYVVVDSTEYLGGTDTWNAGITKDLDLAAYTDGAPPDEEPTVVTNAATNIDDASATINGSLTDMGTASTVSCYFEYGTTTAYGSSCSAVDMTATGSFWCDLSGLSEDTTYHYRAVADGDGTAYGADMTFTTEEEAAPGEFETFSDWLYDMFIS